MGFDFFKIRGNHGVAGPRSEEYLYKNMPKTRTIEKKVKEISPEFGKVIEKVNNTVDTLENLGESIEKMSSGNIIGDGIETILGLNDLDKVKKSLKKGDHIKVQRIGYYHHGIYDGKGSVYEYNEGVIRLVSLKDFADNDKVTVVTNEPTKRSGEEIVRRARVRMGERDYNLIVNNCGNFATWCRIGED